MWWKWLKHNSRCLSAIACSWYVGKCVRFLHSHIRQVYIRGQNRHDWYCDTHKCKYRCNCSFEEELEICAILHLVSHSKVWTHKVVIHVVYQELPQKKDYRLQSLQNLFAKISECVKNQWNLCMQACTTTHRTLFESFPSHWYVT